MNDTTPIPSDQEIYALQRTPFAWSMYKKAVESIGEEQLPFMLEHMKTAGAIFPAAYIPFFIEVAKQLGYQL